jgi:uracil-DNA glycosylase family 4
MAQNDMTPEAALSALHWLTAMGADEAVAETPFDRRVEATAPAPEPAPEPVPGKKPLRMEARQPQAPASPVLADRTADATTAIAQARETAAACQSLADIRAALSRFEACPLSRTASNLVFTEGQASSGLLVLADQPGREDDEEGRPFAGPEGVLLDRMLAAIGLSRETTLLTHLVFWRPPGGRQPNEAEVLMCQPFVERLITLTAPRVILCLGEAPAQRLSGLSTGIFKLRGQWLEWNKLPMLASFHPRMLMNTPGFKADAWKDLQTLKAKLDAAASP